MRGTRRPTAAHGAIVLGVVVLPLLVGGVAQALWRSAGSGAGAATTATTSALVLTPATPSAQLHPGGQASVVLTVSNPATASVRVGSLALDTAQGSNGFAVDGAHSGCGLAALSFTPQTNAGAGWTVDGGESLSITLTDALSMGASAANACQGAAFTVYLVVPS